MGQMKISVITVCYNSSDMLERTVKSVLEQTFESVEYIIIDGGSTDSTLEIINRYKSDIDIVVSEKDNGIYDAMNKGIRLASGDWINFKNAGDCFVSPTSLESFFSEPLGESIGVVHGDCLYVNDWGYYTAKPNCGQIKGTMPVIHPSAFIRTSLHKRMLFDSSFKSSGDFDFFTRCMNEGVVFEYRPITVSSFITGGFATKNRMLTYREDCRILNKRWSVSRLTGFCKLSAQVKILNLMNRFELGRWLYKKYLINQGWHQKDD